MGHLNEILDYPRVKPSVAKKLILKSDPNRDTLQVAMKIPIILMQTFAFLPVHGISEPNYRSLRFKWLSWKLLYSFGSLSGYVFHFTFYCHNCCISRRIENILELNALFFHIEAIVLSMLFIYLAKRWPHFVKQWHHAETTMKNYKPAINLKRKISLMVSVFLGVALVEHSMVMVNKVVLCFKIHQGDWNGAWRQYFESYGFYEIFKHFPYHAWCGVILQFLVLQKTFMWNFLDVFLVLISTCFTFRLKQITMKLTALSKVQVSDAYVWRTVREDYIKLSRLCDSINEHLSWFIIISYVTNIYHILSQLFSSLKPKEDVFEKIYFFISFFLLIVRVVSVCIFGGGIYDEKDEIAKILTSVPSSVYNIEIERFITHLSTCEMVLTGKNFFRITRNLILQIASAIVTYELVLIQFNLKDFKSKDN